MARDEEQKRKHREYMREWARRHPRYRHREHLEYQRRWRAEHPDKVAEHNKKAAVRNRVAYQTNPERQTKAKLSSAEYRRLNLEYYKDYQREWHRRRKAERHGLTAEQYQELLPRMDGPCEICGAMVLMHIDHDHATNAFRGLLCRHCNYVLGFARDRIDVLRKAIEYLKAHGVSEK